MDRCPEWQGHRGDEPNIAMTIAIEPVPTDMPQKIRLFSGDHDEIEPQTETSAVNKVVELDLVPVKFSSVAVGACFSKVPSSIAAQPSSKTTKVTLTWSCVWITGRRSRPDLVNRPPPQDAIPRGHITPQREAARSFGIRPALPDDAGLGDERS